MTSSRPPAWWPLLGGAVCAGLVWLFLWTVWPSGFFFRGGMGEYWLLAGAILFPTLVAGALAWWWAARMTTRLAGVARAAEDIAEGRPQAGIPGLWSDDEVGRLAAAVEKIREGLTARIGRLEIDSRRMEEVVGRMREGLMFAGNDGRIQIANDVFRSLCAVRSDPVGRPLLEVLRVPAVLEAVENALSTGREVEATFDEPSGAGRTFEFHVRPMALAENQQPGVIGLFHDITRLERLESVRREFVANVSHELRTPLTSIKASVETLVEDGGVDPALSLRFLGIVKRQVERMEALLADLTALSLIETGAITFEPVMIDLSGMARDLASQFGPVAAQAGVFLEFDLPRGLLVKADRRRLEQVLVNLIDNALKFNRPGGKVVLSARAEEGATVLTVSDTGIGIPADSLEKIFHRFYRVDPANGGDKVGTGLGLSIVKHLMRLHGGYVQAESELGKGSRFILTFPA